MELPLYHDHTPVAGALSVNARGGIGPAPQRLEPFARRADVPVPEVEGHHFTGVP